MSNSTPRTHFLTAALLASACAWAAPGDVITDLSQLSNNKCYTISTPERGTLVIDNRGYLTTTLGTDYGNWPSDQNDMNYQRFAIVNMNDTYHLYNIATSKFLTLTGEWAKVTDDAGVTFTFDTTHPNGDYIFMIYSGSNCMNSNGSSNIVVNAYHNPDGGNRWKIVEAADFDPTDAVNLINGSVDVTYNIYFNGQKVGQAKSNGVKVDTPATLDAPNFCSYSFSPATITKDTQEVTATLTWDGPFAVSNSFADASWYNLDIRDDHHFISYCSAMDNAVRSVSGYQVYSNRAQFAFIGDPYNGFKVLNKAAGENFAASFNNGMVMTENSSTTWKVRKSTHRGADVNGFHLMEAKSNQALNEQGGALKTWEGWDAGSAFSVHEVDASAIPVGYYRIKGKRSGAGYIGLNDDKLAADFAGTEIGSILTLSSNEDNLTSIQVQGKYVSAPARDNTCTASDAPIYMDYVKTYNDPKITFQNVNGGDHNYLHCSTGKGLIGWNSGDGASFWDIEEVNGIDVAISAAGYATLNVGFPLIIPAGVTAYTGKVHGEYLRLTEAGNTIPANTPVILQGEEGSYTFVIAKGNTDAAPQQDMLGSLLSVAQEGEFVYYVLGKKNDTVGFYKMAEGNQIPSNKAYLKLPSAASVKGFMFDMGGDIETGISSPLSQSLSRGGEEIYNLNGQQLGEAQRGINIIAGKKVLK